MFLLGMASAGNSVARRALTGLETPPHQRVGPISAIFPTFNEEDYLPLCLASVRNQTLRPFEIIVVDYQSIDGTREAAKRHGARVVEIDEPGVGPARDLGAEHATQEILFFGDADCIYEHRLFEEEYSDLTSGRCDIVHVPGAYYDTTNPWFQGLRMFRKLKAGWICDGYSTMTRKEVWREVGGWELPVGEEKHFGRKARNLGFTILARKDLACACSGRIFWGESRASRGRRFLEELEERLSAPTNFH